MASWIGRSCIVASTHVVLQLFLTLSGVDAGPLEKEWQRTKLETGEVTQAEKDMNWLIDWQPNDQTSNDYLASVNNPGVKASKYRLVDFTVDRYKPLCKLIIEKPPLPPAQPSHPANQRRALQIATCSCSFVKENIVMTAAHCFYPKMKDLTTGLERMHHITPKSGFIVYAVQQYGIKGTNVAEHVKHMKAHAHLALEWWEPKAFYPGFVAKAVGPHDGDIAFIRIKGPIAADSLFKLTEPEGKIGSEEYKILEDDRVMALGYPLKYGRSEVALDVKGKIKKEGNLVAFTGKMLRNWAFTGCGTMGCGGSGGPWILSDTWVEMSPKGLKMAVFSVTSYGKGDEDSKEPMYGQLVTKDLISALNIIAGLKATELTRAVPQVPGKAKIANGTPLIDNIDFVELTLP